MKEKKTAELCISCLCFLRLLFWAQSGSFPKIERAGLDGRDTVALVTSSICNPVALSLGMFRYSVQKVLNLCGTLVKFKEVKKKSHLKQ